MSFVMMQPERLTPVALIGYNHLFKTGYPTMKRTLRLFLWILSLRLFSRIWGRTTRLKHPKILIKRWINRFQRNYRVDMTQFQGKPEDYPTLSEFFIRPLDPEKRPISRNENLLVSPADGTCLQLETLYADQATQVKHRTYSIRKLIAEAIDFSIGWHVATIYLSPSDYHRFHYPLSATIHGYIHTGRFLFPVNAMGLNHVKNLFIRNERIVTKFEKDGHFFYIAVVGACFVGSIKMNHVLSPGLDRKWKSMSLKVSQLDEMGRFEMGSTIVLVLPEKMGVPVSSITGKRVQVGDPLFKLKPVLK